VSVRNRAPVTAVPVAPHSVVLASVSKSFGEGPGGVLALDGVSLAVPAGRFVAVMGPSGSGKSTLLQVAAGLEAPTSGSVSVNGTSLSGLDDDALTRFRRLHVGFVFQHYNLLPYLTASDNVELPLRATGRRVERRRVATALTSVGLARRGGHLPGQLSGGEQQRVALARALVTSPAVLFADEPTGALDTHAARQVLGLLRDACDRAGQTIVMVTHDPIAAGHADEVVFLADGTLAGRLEQPTADAVAARMARLGAEQER